MEIVYFITGVFISIAFILLIIDRFTFNKKVKLNKRHEPNSICFLLPARNESRVITSLLKSIRNQDYDNSKIDIYVIVEDKSDPTIEIARKYDASVIIRKKLNLKTKGYALMEGIECLQKNNITYDMYFIIDADNILSKSFVSNMVNSYKSGYDVATGYRNSKNGNKNLITISSTLTFTLINTMFNEFKIRRNRPITLSGTGMYISGNLVNKWQTFPFRSLTEDYELSLFMTLNNITSTYNKKAIFYDEQPASMQESIIQRTRWVKGFFTVRRKKIKKLKDNLDNKSVLGEYIGIKPYLFLVIGVIFLIISQIVNIIIKIINNSFKINDLLLIIAIVLTIYLILVFITAIMLKKEEKQFNLSLTSKLKALFYNPIFLSTYVICLINAFTNKYNKWEVIKHGK